MKKFVIDCNGGDSIVVEAKTAKAAAKIASEKRIYSLPCTPSRWDEKQSVK